MAAMVLAGCSGADVPAPPEIAIGSPGAEQPGTEDVPESCGSIGLLDGAVVASETFGTCLVDYLRFAGSGASETTSSVASSSMVWRLHDEYEAHARLDNGTQMLVTGNGAWVDFGDTGWAFADPADEAMAVPFAMVEAWRQTSAPEVARDLVLAAPSWVATGPELVDLPDGTSQELFRMSATAPYSWMGAGVDAISFWMLEPGRIILQETTATVGEFTETSTTHFTQWGGDVEIPVP